jgi:hypothetical protein
VLELCRLFFCPWVAGIVAQIHSVHECESCGVNASFDDVVSGAGPVPSAPSACPAPDASLGLLPELVALAL